MNHRVRLRGEALLPVLAVAALIFSGEAWGEEARVQAWPQWRGPSRDAQVKESPPWPKDLATLTREWRVELGPGYSGPIVWGDRVFVTETEAKTDESVRALDRATGLELWRTRWSGAMSVPFFARKNGDWIRATPACDGESLFVAGMRDVLVCLNIETGAERWRVDFSDKLGTPLPSFGFVCSPLVMGEHVYVQAGGGFVKLNKRSGEILWRTLIDGGGMNSAFSSPIAATLHGIPQLIVQTRETLAGVAPDTGEILWSQKVPAFRGMNILTPTLFQDGILTSSYQNKTFFYRIEKEDSGLKVREAWTVPVQGYMSSPVIIGRYAYLHLGNGRACCLDLQEGKETWRTNPFGEYWSMVANGDRILALDEQGELLLIEADPREFRLLDRKEVASAEAWAHLAVSGDRVFVRDLRGVSAFVWK
ncbi:MAG: PQQ-binding-like beta-propeller repeat protein [Phycisphaerae bacterium]|nr:MAG: pyrrolo-quinoline quinone [Planctomycetota bacterium]KAB2949228.1 MAG: PQQ-binding-like beta-propeller repeat protein [Phycisphaerae bacterium]MBE7455706.1 PQQ-binding-like beta-propeller repeat protein [Planctomycetia bacterium]MCK6463342.1 PQQ-binding-like beta-propeller repeat protein [Phycisphaerae bacterium]MCL4716964.1 PQQ-binding-like beta-propeller repeat protein [Phycisphaerae bacterium]